MSMSFGKTRHDTPNLMLTPLIDVVFLLLIFFLLASTFLPRDVLEVQPPESAASERWSNPAVTVLVDARGRVAVNNRVVNADALQSVLTAELHEKADRSITIKADHSTSSGLIVHVLLAAQNAHAGDVRLVTVANAGVE